MTTIRFAALPVVLLASALVATTADTAHATGKTLPCAETTQPLVIAHRGASGYIPEHTLAAYAFAIEQGVDYIEPDLVMTKDGVLVARHENEIGGTTDVADRPEFASRQTTKIIDGATFSGWFTEDFTLAELKTLRTKERIPQLRPINDRYKGMFQVPTLQEVIDLARGVNFRFQLEAAAKGETTRRCVGIYPETKHPTYHDSIGLSMEEPLVRALHAAPFFRTAKKVFIQSFEVANLKQLATMTDLPLVQLMFPGGKPYDFVVAGDPRTYDDMATPAGLAEIATYADGVGVFKDFMIPRTAAGNLGTPTTLLADAHGAGLIVHGWTFRAENNFLPVEFRSSADPLQLGDLPGEIEAYLDQGMDGFFTDHPDIGVRARDAFVD